MKEYCDITNLPYHIVDKGTLRKVFSPTFYGCDDKQEIFEFSSPEVFVSEIENASVVGGNGFVLSGEYCLYDFFLLNDEGRYNLQYGSVKSIVADSVMVESAHTDIEIEEAICLLGHAANNYYHFTVDLLSRLQYADKYIEYHSLPILVDRIAVEKYSQLIDLVNVHKHPVISIKNNHLYKVSKLIYPSYNTWCPIYMKDGELVQPKDFLIADSAVSFFRKKRKLSDKTDKRIFVSRRNAINSRLKNEADVAKLFERYGFEVVCLEEMTFMEEIELLSKVKYFVGVMGAAFTNILFLPQNAKAIMIFPKEEKNSCLYSTIAGIAGVSFTCLNANLLGRRSYELDLDYCNEFLSEISTE